MITNAIRPFVLFNDWLLTLAIARREVKDTLRDWRLVFPILGLTLFFPGLMTFFATRIVSLVDSYGSELLGLRSLPILLMIVGFFPTSFSLVIALEAFVGEKERKSLEPLLSTPLTDKQLFIGKLLAAVLPPVMASYVGIAVYSLGVTIFVGPMASEAILLVVTLTTVQAFLMVAASVVVSSQATSTRAANMLASFIIVPVSLLLQAEAVLMAFEYYSALWWMLLAIFLAACIFTRIGIQLFNRENLLGRNLDFIKVGWAYKRFINRFLGRDEEGEMPSIGQWYRQNLNLVWGMKLPIYILGLMFFVSILIGMLAAFLFPLPSELLLQLRSSQTQVQISVMRELLADLPLFIFAHNIRAIGLLVILGTLSFGVLSILIYMLPWGVIAFITTQFALVGENPLVFVSATVLPHAWVEFPILIVVTAAALRWQATLIAPPGRRLVSEMWVESAADFFRILIGYGIPLFFIAALLESFFTPYIIALVYG
ncbi:MAG: stage II sporulation protein M [Chloroflexota bacterium]